MNTAVWNSLSASPITVSQQTFSTQTAAIGTTTILTPTLGGFFEVCYYLAIPSGLSATGAINTVISWVDAIGAQTYTSVSLAVTGKGFVQDTVFIQTQGGSNITFSTTFLTVIGTISYNYSVLLKRYQ